MSRPSPTVSVMMDAARAAGRRLIRDVGMGVALSLSAVVQLVAVNLVALAFFGERVSGVQAVGLLLAVIAVAMITLGPARG